MRITGAVYDTSLHQPVANALITAVRVQDSVLVAFERTDDAGRFEMSMRYDTLEITISAKGWGRQTYFVFGNETNDVFDFGRVVLPPKSLQLAEVIIYAFKDPVYYKGDTLVYTADSFKVKPNATVEDLLKRLPGVAVDSDGKIKVQGRQVDQVLVDGDEFFGPDPTVATRNLSAEGLSQVQVYEKKNENATDGGEETIQVMDLKLKENAKKGYFGKVSGGTDGRDFYEGELLANRFKGSQKISVFAMSANTPRSGFNWNDMFRYGLDNELNYNQDDDGSRFYYMTNNPTQGIPRTFKSGLYYSDRLSKTTKVNFNYTYNNNRLSSAGSTRSQFFFPDTSYVTDQSGVSTQFNDGHTFNAKLVQTIDSLLDLEIEPRLRLTNTRQAGNQQTRFLTANGGLTRETDVTNNSASESHNFSTNVRFTRRFKNRERLLRLNYFFAANESNTNAFIKSFHTVYDTIAVHETMDQKQTTAFDDVSHQINAVHTEPLNKKIKLEFEYNFNIGLSTQDKQTQNFINGEYNEHEPLFSNQFRHEKTTHRLGGKFNYETRKQGFSTGVRLRDVNVLNTNLETAETLPQHQQNVLPYATYHYKFSDNMRLHVRFHTTSNLPTVQQLQPVPDNTDPNRVRLGNPGLVPTFAHNIGIRFNTHKPVTGRYLWSTASFSVTDNDFANSIVYDTLGRSISQTVNVDGNKSAQFYTGGGVNFFDKKFGVFPSISTSYNSRTNFVNGLKNITETWSVGPELRAALQLDSLEFDIGYRYNYNKPVSTLSELTNRPYRDQVLSASLSVRLPLKFIVQTDAEYTINEDRADGYNTRYVIWNASLHKLFFKNETVIVGVEGFDLLNQNVYTRRNVQDNVITDSNTNLISRYFLLRLTYKFNSTKTKDPDDGFF